MRRSGAEFEADWGAVWACAIAGVDDSPGLRDRLVAACIRAETEVAGAPTGGMDQTVSLLASADHALLIDFDADDVAATVRMVRMLEVLAGWREPAGPLAHNA